MQRGPDGNAGFRMLCCELAGCAGGPGVEELGEGVRTVGGVRLQAGQVGLPVAALPGTHSPAATPTSYQGHVFPRM